MDSEEAAAVVVDSVEAAAVDCSEDWVVCSTREAAREAPEVMEVETTEAVTTEDILVEVTVE